ncbi:hypothetical protein [Streptomyces sp. R41]|uniref:Uncharacterized protein n=1 Tax=Streptomyces sp. R41 TaxID=3238632 RepID=A0AB39RBC4_9ACTN
MAGGLREVQQAVLRHFAATGHAPGIVEREAAAAAHGRTAGEAMAELSGDDFRASQVRRAM